MNILQSEKLSDAIQRSLKFTFDKIFPLIICTIGASIQVTTLVTMYFEFPASTIIELYRPSMVTLPSLSVCYYYKLDPRNASKLRIQPFNSSLTDHDLRFQLTVGEIDSITPGFMDLIKYCKVALPSSLDESRTYNACSDARPLEVNINAYEKCFTFFGGLSPSFLYNRNEFYDDFILKIAINSDITFDDTVEIHIHETQEELTYSNGSPWQMTLNWKANNLYILSYLMTQSHGLGPPYSECMTYSALTGKSRHDLIKKCMSRSVYEENYAFHDRTFIRVSKEVINSTFKQGIQLNKHRSECEEKFSNPECHTQLFQIQKLRAMNWESLPRNQTLILFAYPLGFQSNVTTREKLNFIEYFCYVASVISLWLEVSLLSVVNFLFVHTRKICVRLMRKRKRINEIKRISSKMYVNENRKPFALKSTPRIQRNRIELLQSNLMNGKYYHRNQIF